MASHQKNLEGTEARWLQTDIMLVPGTECFCEGLCVFKHLFTSSAIVGKDTVLFKINTAQSSYLFQMMLIKVLNQNVLLVPASVQPLRSASGTNEGCCRCSLMLGLQMNFKLIKVSKKSGKDKPCLIVKLEKNSWFCWYSASWCR